MLTQDLQLVRPLARYLPGYVNALERGWSPDNLRGDAVIAEDLASIAAAPERFLASLTDREARGAPIVLPDGSLVARLPGFTRWLWDGEFCGVIGLRWQRGTSTLPPSCPGHIGYAVVPWKRGRGYATQALRLLLPEARAEGLEWVELSTEPGNVASQRVIEANRGVLVERFRKPASLGGSEALRYRIDLG